MIIAYMEIWKEFKQIHRNKGIDIKYLFSNKGNIKLTAYYKDIFLGEELLTIGHGIYVNKGELNVYHMSKIPIYRIFYILFVGDIEKGYQIHHKDYNHYNNNIDNLLCVSPWEHGCIHTNTSRFLYEIPQINDTDYKEYQLWLSSNDYMDRINKIKYSIDNSKDDINKIYNHFESKIEEARKVYNQRNKDKQKQKEELYLIDKDNKLKSGEYAINSLGYIYKKKHKTWTDEQRKEIISKRACIYTDEWRQHVREGMKKHL